MVVTMSEPDLGSTLFSVYIGFHFPLEIFCISCEPFFPLKTEPKACSRPTPLNSFFLFILSYPIVLSAILFKGYSLEFFFSTINPPFTPPNLNNGIFFISFN